MTNPRPCSWQGVVCTNGRVTALHLPRMGLSGKLPAGLGNLTKLQTLSLRFNALTGPIPVDLGNLAHLDTLTLEHNGFTGSVPDFSAPPLTHFNVSYNHLNGSIPKRFWRLDKSAFEGNLLCGVPLQPCPGSNNGSKDKTRKSGKLSKLILILGIVIVSLFGALILLLLFCLGRKTRQSGDSSNAEASEHVEAIGDGGSAVSDSASASPRMENILVFFGNTEIGSTLSFDELMDGTAVALGIGTFGITYRMMRRSLCNGKLICSVTW
ncbi:probable inactive receptor kinase At5g16590 [Lotus japonicus]|uniref:probable inactive receptor kinase At5g16590 n=1 Tax=Lotus japonicus TaxID=34305 RepID=UPI00258E8473|nr:probable inactive receptor kinase At5g16590 [Lotus japonicus]